MNRADAIRIAVAWLPLGVTIMIAILRRPTRRLLAGVLVALLWNAWSLLFVNIVAIHIGWWSFDPALPSFMGVAAEPWLAWTVIWGAVVPLAAHDRSVVVVVLGVVWLDLIGMPLLDPMLALNSRWLLGEGLAIVVSLIPGLLVARWTATDDRLGGRAIIQVVCSGAFFMWLIPGAALMRTDGWDALGGLPSWRLGLGVQLLLFPIALGVRAVAEFVRRGRGTPIPYDPPRSLVTSGPYSYVRNPMQVAIVLMFLIAAAVVIDAWLALAAAMAFAYGAGLAEWHENEDLSERFGADWIRYRDNVRPWIPTVKPHVSGEATLLVAYSCATCSSVGRWFVSHNPIGLSIAPAESSDDLGIRRITYVPASGPRARGVSAVAHALEHINLGWAVVGWFLMLPGVLHFAQVIVDLFGPSPGRVAGLPYDAAACRVEGTR